MNEIEIDIAMEIRDLIKRLARSKSGRNTPNLAEILSRLVDRIEFLESDIERLAERKLDKEIIW